MNNIEDVILGHLLLRPELFKKTVITDKHFLNERNKFIFRLLKKQYDVDQTINIIGIAENYKNEFSIKNPLNEVINKLTELLFSSGIQINKSSDSFSDDDSSSLNLKFISSPSSSFIISSSIVSI